MLLIRNIGRLVLPTSHPAPVRVDRGVETVEHAYVAVDGATITAYGPDAECPLEVSPGDSDALRPSTGAGPMTAAANETSPNDVRVIDAGGKCVTPGLIDCHTHAVFAGSREKEFVQRIEGKSYAEIAEAGGGIMTTVGAVREASVDQLVALALPRLERMLAGGVTTVEIKSGYGLSIEDEIKMLDAVRRLKRLTPVELVPTYLGAHTVPAEYARRREAYMGMVCSDELMGRVAREGLAEFCDVFCERTAFTLDESRRVLLKGREYGLIPKLHADQIAQMGASRLAAEVGAVSADHLETIDDAGIAALKDAGVVAVLLPGCSWFLGVAPAPARRIIDAGVPVALATDYNPGSAMVESLALCLSIACTQMRMTPAECLLAVTTNAAAALNRADRLGRIAPGMQADLVVFDVDNVDQIPYQVGRHCVRTVIKAGVVVFESVEQ